MMAKFTKRLGVINVVMPARIIVQEWVDGCTIVELERLKMQFDITHIYFGFTPLMSLG
jgi:hypothetical protein